MLTNLFVLIIFLSVPIVEPKNGENKKSSSVTTTIATVREVEVVIEVTPDFIDQFPSVASAENYITDVMSIVSKSIRRDINVEIKINDIISHTSEPPWKSECTEDQNSDGVVNYNDYFMCLMNHWNGISFQSVSRDFILWIHYPPQGQIQGQGYVSGLCEKNGCARSSLDIYALNPNEIPFQDPLSSLRIIMHEVGHVLGIKHPYGVTSSHSSGCNHTRTEFSCDDIDSRSVMSNCTPREFRYYPGGSALVDCFMQNQFACENQIPITVMGDYDHDGVLTASDVSQCRMCLSYNYPFKGCRDIFDVDGNGSVSVCDCNTLSHSIQGISDCNQNQIIDGCSGDTSITDCNSNGISDGCEVNSNNDCNNNSVIDFCESVPSISVVTSGSRSLSINFPTLCTKKVFIDVMKNSDGTHYYVQSNGTLGNTPVFKNFKEWGNLVIVDDKVRPSNTYTIRIYSYTNQQGLVYFGQATTWMWGDLNGNGQVNQADIDCILQCYSGNCTTCSKTACDIHPVVPNNVINLSDIMLELNAVGGQPYPY